MNTQRDVFWNELYKQAKNDRDIIIVSADMGAPSLDKFRRDLPAQFINTGIAEQNSILIASGLAKEGKKVFVYAISSFLTLNSIEKIRVQNSMMKIPINLVGVGTGLSYPDSGPTHHLLEDMAIMRSLPNIKVFTMSDNRMAELMVKEALLENSTTYIRLERQITNTIYSSECDINFNDSMSLIKKGKKTLLISNGFMLSILKDLLVKRFPDYGLCDLFRFPVNQDILSSIVKDFDLIFCIEEGFLPGGLGSTILECLNDLNIYKKVIRIGADPERGYSYNYGGREFIQKYYGIDTDSLIKKISMYSI